MNVLESIRLKYCIQSTSRLFSLKNEHFNYALGNPKETFIYPILVERLLKSPNVPNFKYPLWDKNIFFSSSSTVSGEQSSGSFILVANIFKI